MGCFSFINADTGNNILGGEKINLLCPDGSILTDSYYDLYGNVAGHDVYFLLAMWNRRQVLDNKKELDFNPFKNEAYKLFFDDNVSDDYLYQNEESITDELRIIGIDIYFLANPVLRNKVIKYPLKFVEDTKLSYDDVEESLDDPCQGFSIYNKDKGEYLGICAWCGKEIWKNENYYSDSSEGPVCSYDCYEEICKNYDDEDDNYDYFEDEEED